MEKIKILIDEKSGLEYLDNLPDGFEKASINDFHVKGKKKIGMLFLMHSPIYDCYYPKTVTESLTAISLMPFINAGQVYVKK